MSTLNPQERFEILRTEMGLIQSVLDKYDSLAIQTRNWSAALWAGATGFGLSTPDKSMHLLALGVAVFAVYAEGALRQRYWQKYVNRYRRIRNALNAADFSIDSFPIYDMTDSLSPKSPESWRMIIKGYFRPEHLVVYAFLASASLFLYLTKP